jgi:hypothetical protein
VWSRTLLETPDGRDDTTCVLWLQTARWHADLRVPALPAGTALDAGAAVSLARRASLQGFLGVTTVDLRDGVEQCTWHRKFDVQPASAMPDAGWLAFETPDRLIETGVHGVYREVWQRLPQSGGRQAVLCAMPPGASSTQASPPTGSPADPFDAHPSAAWATAITWLLLAGDHVMRVRPRAAPWPADTRPPDTLASVLQRHPALAPALLDFEISHGLLEGDELVIQQSTLPGCAGTREPFVLQRHSDSEAELHGAGATSVWSIVEWADG